MSKITCDTKRLDSLLRQVSKGDKGVRIGFFDDSGKHPRSGATAYEVASINNNGAPEADIPERPFVTDGAYEREEQSHTDLRTAIRDVHRGLTTYNKALRKAAETQRDAIQAQLLLAPFEYTANAKSTQASKGGRNTPLLETGWLRKQIDIKYD